VSARNRARNALHAALAAPAAGESPDPPPQRLQTPPQAAQARSSVSRRGAASPAPVERRAGDVDALADELAGLGADLPSALTPEERRAAILRQLH